MVRYRLVIDYDAEFHHFHGELHRPDRNNSFLFATLNSTVPEITVTDSAPPNSDGLVPFGSVTELTSATQTVTVTNTGSGDLVLGTIGQSNPWAAFALATDHCSGQTLRRRPACTVDVTFSPPSTRPFNSSFDYTLERSGRARRNRPGFGDRRSVAGSKGVRQDSAGERGRRPSAPSRRASRQARP